MHPGAPPWPSGPKIPLSPLIPGPGGPGGPRVPLTPAFSYTRAELTKREVNQIQDTQRRLTTLSARWSHLSSFPFWPRNADSS